MTCQCRVEKARLLGATVIVTGLSSEIARTLVRLNLDLGSMLTMGDLQAGIEEAERLLGYTVATVTWGSPPPPEPAPPESKS